jgi:hypothetical protein
VVQVQAWKGFDGLLPTQYGLQIDGDRKACESQLQSGKKQMSALQKDSRSDYSKVNAFLVMTEKGSDLERFSVTVISKKSTFQNPS